MEPNAMKLKRNWKLKVQIFMKKGNRNYNNSIGDYRQKSPGSIIHSIKNKIRGFIGNAGMKQRVNY